MKAAIVVITCLVLLQAALAAIPIRRRHSTITSPIDAQPATASSTLTTQPVPAPAISSNSVAGSSLTSPSAVASASRGVTDNQGGEGSSIVTKVGFDGSSSSSGSGKKHDRGHGHTKDDTCAPVIKYGPITPYPPGPLDGVCSGNIICFPAFIPPEVYDPTYQCPPGYSPSGGAGANLKCTRITSACPPGYTTPDNGRPCCQLSKSSSCTDTEYGAPGCPAGATSAKEDCVVEKQPPVYSQHPDKPGKGLYDTGSSSTYESAVTAQSTYTTADAAASATAGDSATLSTSDYKPGKDKPEKPPKPYHPPPIKKCKYHCCFERTAVNCVDEQTTTTPTAPIRSCDQPCQYSPSLNQCVRSPGAFSPCPSGTKECVIAGDRACVRTDACFNVDWCAIANLAWTAGYNTRITCQG
eukprot:jgi/Chrzof1/6442/Cz18g11030.t1